MTHAETVIALIRGFGAARGVAATTASRLLAGNGDTLLRLERGASLSAARARAIEARARDLWPAAAERGELGRASRALDLIERADRAAAKARAAVLDAPTEAA